MKANTPGYRQRLGSGPLSSQAGASPLAVVSARVLAGRCPHMASPRCVQREGTGSPQVPLLQTPILLDQGPTLVTLFDLNDFLRGPSPNTASWGVRTLLYLTYEFWGHTHSAHNTNCKFILKLTSIQNLPTYPISCFQGK